jgi:murein DD-endopeptidase MepM/ murein hydrolase activator NlpD
MFGEVFSSSRLVVNTPVNADYLATTSDIIPKKEIAVTTIPEARQRTEALDYAVQSGDTLYSIGTKFKVSSDALKYVNNLSDSSILSVGQKLTIPPVAGLIHTVVSGDSLASIAAEYDVPSQSIADFNYLLDNNLTVGTDLVIPGAKIPQAPVIQQPNDTYIPSSIGSGSNVKADPNFCAWPSTVTDISQGFWWGHTAIDIDTNPNGPMPPLFACNDGVVTRAGWDVWGLGLRVTIDHGNGITTTYGHMSRIDVSVGQRVKRGQIIGLMGSTFAPPYGHSTGPHVHFIVDYNGVPQNPLNFTHR